MTNVKTDEIERRGLKPALMTRYSRTAFQFASTNAVRISLDEDLRWSDVRAQGTRAIESPMSYTYTQPFQYAVLEVKLTSAADGTAAWIEDILATLKAVKVYKFSKYIHGCAKLMPHAVYKLPHWFDEGFEERRTKAVDEPTSRFASSGSFADLLRTTITNALGFRKHGVAKEERRSASEKANRTSKLRIREDFRHVTFPSKSSRKRSSRTSERCCSGCRWRYSF